MEAYSQLVDEIGALLDTPFGSESQRESATLVIRDRPYQALRELVPIETLRETGVFFTGYEMAEKLWAALEPTLGIDSIVLDPACGAGDLLLPGVELLAKHVAPDDLPTRFRGLERVSEFVQAARTRLLLQSRLINGSDSPNPLKFDFVRVGDTLKPPSGLYDRVTHVLLNPPFSSMKTPEGVEWSKGSVNSAAVFVSQCLADMEVGSRLYAILPDVLRSGARYEQWRHSIQEVGAVAAVVELGQFDINTDIHVFLLEIVKGEEGSSIPFGSPTDVEMQNKLGEKFEVHVGSVVPHRHAEDGPVVTYVSAHTLAGDRIETSFPDRRRYSGRLDRGPVVVVRRTSRPGEKRARATLIDSAEEIAFENHLLVLTPRDGQRDTCLSLLDVLDDSRTSAFLDDRIRCRHLTVSSVKEIPWWAGE